MDKINARNYMKCSKKVLKKCLKMCGKAIHIPQLYDGRVKNREKKLCIFRVKIVNDNKCRPVNCVKQGA